MRGRCVSGHLVRASRSSRIRHRSALTEGLGKGKEKIGFRLCSPFSRFALVLSLSLACSSIFEKNRKQHMCTRLDQQFLVYLTAGFTNLNASQSLVGYLQVSGPKFHRDLCLPEKRKEWLSNFASKHYHYHYYTNLAPKLRHIC